MSNFKIIAEPWNDFCSTEPDTEALYLNTDNLYTVSEFITLLEEAKKRWGDKQVVIQGSDNIIGGFSHVYLHHGYDKREEYGDEDYYQDDQICIFF